MVRICKTRGLHRQIEAVSELTGKYIYENASFVLNQDEFNGRHQRYIERHRKATEKVAVLEDQQRNRHNKSLILDGFIQEIETRPPVIEEFDRKLWSVPVDKVTVHRDETSYRWQGGTALS